MAETVLDIFEATREVRQRGLLYVGPEVSPEAIAKNPELQELEATLGGFTTKELAELIIDEAADYSSRAVGVRLAVMVKRYIEVQDEAATQLLTAGPITVTRLKDSQPYCVADFSGEEPKDITGPVTGMVGEVHVGLGWFNLATKKMEVTVNPLDYAGVAQVNIATGAK